MMVISQFYPLLGGAEVQARELARALVTKGVTVSVLTRRLKGVPASEVLDDVPVHRAIRTVPVPFLWGASFMISVFIFLYRKRKEYTIIHCHILQEFQTVVALLFKGMFNKKVIVKMSSSGETSDIKLLKRSLTGKLFYPFIKKVDAVISVCKQSTHELVNGGFSEERIAEIPNGVDIERFVQHPPRQGQQRPTITFVGRLDRYKGVDFLLEAFQRVLSEGNNARLLIVGTGPDETFLKRRVLALHLEENILFLGKREDTVSLLLDSDVFVLPTLSEGMSNVLLEAMSCGLPVVTTSVGGNCDLISNGHNGILVPPGDSEALSDALMGILQNTALAQQLGEEARRTVEKHYSLGSITDSYLALYNKIAS
jgi:glycosyltransferase involved in cell wall biosynthesis